MQTINKLKGWLDALEECRANPPPTPHPDHHKRLKEIIRHLEFQLRNREARRKGEV